MTPLQPHEGSSETPRYYCRDLLSIRFNPTRVRLKPCCHGVYTILTGGFNPTRVRLKLARAIRYVTFMLASTPRGFV